MFGALIGRKFDVGHSRPNLARLTRVAPSIIIPAPSLEFNILGVSIKLALSQRQRGLFAKRDIPAGSYIGTYEGIIVDMSYLNELDEDVKYVLFPEGVRSLGVLGDNVLIMSNHSPVGTANMSLVGMDFRAATDVLKGEELTWPYFKGEWNDQNPIYLPNRGAQPS
jgi:hypothetical protein